MPTPGNPSLYQQTKSPTTGSVPKNLESMHLDNPMSAISLVSPFQSAEKKLFVNADRVVQGAVNHPQRPKLFLFAFS
jgi:hypothetical protein